MAQSKLRRGGNEIYKGILSFIKRSFHHILSDNGGNLRYVERYVGMPVAVSVFSDLLEVISYTSDSLLKRGTFFFFPENICFRLLERLVLSQMIILKFTGLCL